MSVKISEIYNNLLDFESKSKKGGSEERLYPIHKKLDFKEGKLSDISDWIIENLELNENDSILDAGCGVGYVLTKICKNFNCTGLGISLSEKEISYATKVCREMGLEKQISFIQKSFDDGFNKKFDVIIAIESIKHSESIQSTIENLVSHLKPGGRIFILDDFETDKRFQFLKNQVKQFWAVNSFYSLNSVTDKFEQLKLPIRIVDFTTNVDYTNKRFTGLKMLLGYLFLPITWLFRMNKIYNIFYAGFCLERLYKKRAVEYKAILATKITSL